MLAGTRAPRVDRVSEEDVVPTRAPVRAAPETKKPALFTTEEEDSADEEEPSSSHGCQRGPSTAAQTKSMNCRTSGALPLAPSRTRFYESSPSATRPDTADPVTAD